MTTTYHCVLTIAHTSPSGATKSVTLDTTITHKQGVTRQGVYKEALRTLCLHAGIPVKEARTLFWSMEPNQLAGGVR